MGRARTSLAWSKLIWVYARTVVVLLVPLCFS